MFVHPQLTALAAIVETGSFEAAADRLNVTPSAVSQRIRGLEERVGGPVVTRSFPAEATELGRKIAGHAAQMARLDTELTEELGERDRLSIAIAVNADSLATWFLPALAGHDQRLFRVMVDDQDHSDDMLRRGDVAAAVTAREEPVQGADSVPLGRLRYIATASPAFADRYFRDGLTAEAFAEAPALVFSPKDTLQSSWASERAGRPVTLPSHYLPTTRGFVDAAGLGVGWGMNPEPLVRDAIEAGQLVALDERTPLDTPLFWQYHRVGSRALEPLTLSVRLAARSILLQDD